MRDVATLLRMGQQLAIRKWRQSPFGPKSTFDGELAKAGLDFGRWHAGRRASRRQFVEIDDAAVARLQTLLPGMAKRTIASAVKALAHEFDLLGSGPYRAVDPDRGPSPRGYQPIDWALDPVRGVRFRNDVPYKEWKLFEMRPGDADIKFPWELARCQQFAPLGQAWRLTHEAHYAHEILDQIEDFGQVLRG